MQHEILTAAPLLNEKGDLREPGYARKLLPIYREDMAQRLSVPDEGRDEVIQLLQLLRGHIDPFSGLGKQRPVTLLSLFRTVKVLVGSAGFLCSAAITDIRR